jgi:hypothetical protein
MAQFVESFIRLYPCGYCGDTSYQVGHPEGDLSVATLTGRACSA